MLLALNDLLKLFFKGRGRVSIVATVKRNMHALSAPAVYTTKMTSNRL